MPMFVRAGPSHPRCTHISRIRRLRCFSYNLGLVQVQQSIKFNAELVLVPFILVAALDFALKCIEADFKMKTSKA